MTKSNKGKTVATKTTKVNKPTTSKNCNDSTGCGFVTITKYISTTPSGNYRVKVGNTTRTCTSKAAAFRMRKELLNGRA